MVTLRKNSPIHLVSPEPNQPRFRRGLLWNLGRNGHSSTAPSALYHSRPSVYEFGLEILSTTSPCSIPAFEQLLTVPIHRVFNLSSWVYVVFLALRKHTTECWGCLFVFTSRVTFLPHLQSIGLIRQTHI